MDYKRLPYGVPSFIWIKQQNRYFSDKKNCTSIHSGIQAERNAQGFVAAYLSHSGYYYVVQEMELNGGYCDLAILPDNVRFPEVVHGYLIELKYIKTTDTDETGDFGFT